MRSFGEPLVLEYVGSRFIGGRRVEQTDREVTTVQLSPGLTGYRNDPNDTFAIEQAYVASYVPANRVQETPVLFVAGGGLTGACWETTPDGRPGWLVDFLRAGIPVDVLDNVERGRAGWCALPDVWTGEPVVRGERDMWRSFRIGPDDGYAARIPFAGSQFPVESLGDLLKQSVPRWPTNDALAARTLVDVLGELGPRVLVGHSHGGGLAARAAATPGTQVAAAVLVEPHGLPATDSYEVGPGHPPIAVVTGDFIDRSDLWQDLAPRMRGYADHLASRGVQVEQLDLPAAGLPGNSHNPMMDRNSSEVAGLILGSLRRYREAGRLS